MERSEDNLWESVLSFHHMDPGDCTQVIRLGSERFDLLSHLTGHLINIPE